MLILLSFLMQVAPRERTGFPGEARTTLGGSGIRRMGVWGRQRPGELSHHGASLRVSREKGGMGRDTKGTVQNMDSKSTLQQVAFPLCTVASSRKNKAVLIWTPEGPYIARVLRF